MAESGWSYDDIYHRPVGSLHRGHYAATLRLNLGWLTEAGGESTSNEVLPRMKSLTALLSIVVALSLGGTATADSKLDNFREAAKSGANSCRVIPYDETREECRKAQDAFERVNAVKSSCDDLDRGQADFRSELARRMEATQTKIDRRRDVRKVYDNADNLLSNESADELRPYVEIIRDKIKGGRAGHERAVSDFEASLKKCEMMAR